MVSSNNAINDTVGATISGVTNTFTVTNQSNTASSAARETITVGGGTAADPTINWNVNGVTDWEMGIDNSVNDNLTIAQSTALGTKDVWRMNTNGARIMPLQPAFLAYLNAPVANVTGDGTVYTMIYDTVLFDQASNYTAVGPNAGSFTAPVTGVYILSATVLGNNFNGGHTDGNVQILIGTQRYIGIDCNPVAMASGANQLSWPVNAITKMNAGDKAHVEFTVFHGTKTVGLFNNTTSCFFSAALIC